MGTTTGKEAAEAAAQFARDALATRAAQAPAQAVPAGWKLVPVEPTQEMVAAGRGCFEKWGSVQRGYAAMLAAAPTPPAAPAMPAGCTTPEGCRAHGCHGACLPPAAAEARDAEIAAREALAEFRQQDDYLLAHGASLMSEDSHEILHMDTLRRIVAAALAAHQKGGGE